MRAKRPCLSIYSLFFYYGGLETGTKGSYTKYSQNETGLGHVVAVIKLEINVNSRSPTQRIYVSYVDNTISSSTTYYTAGLF